jgi:general stress protein 26
MDVSSFAEIEKEFSDRTQRIVWCSVSTVDRKGRPRSRILHPIWEGTTGWILTGRNSFKTKHLAGNPYVSLSYWDPEHQQVYAECRAGWVEDPAEKRRIWELCKTTPEPVGYDPILFFRDGPDSPDFGVLCLTPWRIEISAIADMVQGKPPRVWRQEA